jgi:hypothetical protein
MKNAGGYLIGGGIALLVGFGLWYKFIRTVPTNAAENNNSGEGNGSGSNPDTTGNPKTNPPVLPINYSGKKVSDVLLKTSQNLLAGKNIYAAYDNTQIYTTTNAPYTKAKKGQLIGVFAGSTPASAGGNMVNIKTTNPQNVYVKAFDGSLKF